MKQPLVIALSLALLATPVSAQEVGGDAGGDVDRGFSLLQEGAQSLFRGLMDEMKPQLDEMQKGLGEAAAQLGPKLRQFLALVDDMSNYGAPERLPNGDIIMRRNADAPPPPPLMTEPPEDAPQKDAPNQGGPIEIPEGGIEL
ncbi:MULTISPECIES: AAA+ family ATPase [Thioclava]|uniref:AAA+ family ATPase n=1 Tax=Thioclava TaxID=285107 RepID=UPI0023A89708|nr:MULTISPECIES: AAA+ family ATPase [Thioclava]